MNVNLPLVDGWYNGQQVEYIQIEASDPAVAKDQNVNYAPELAYAANTNAVANIYVFTNYKQVNVINSAPNPAGPTNNDTDYSPLWQVNMVTWNSGITPQTLTSEADIKNAEKTEQLTINKTNIVVNCPVISTPQGGTLPTASIH